MSLFIINENNTYKDSLSVYDSLPDDEKILVAPRGRFVDSPALLVRISNKQGFCEIYKFNGDPSIGFICIAVSPKYRHMGIADKLLNEAIRKAKKKGVNKLIYRVEKTNNPSKIVAVRNGFTLENQTKTQLTYVMNLK